MSAILDPVKQATVPFADLKSSDAINARPLTKDGIDALAASILAKGIIQPLAVRPSDSGDKFEVIDGRRRHAALAKLVKEKRLPKSHPVPVIIRNEDDEQALESSLIANTVRLPMHPVDQYVVFARLSGEGASDADIAARFGITERTVRQHKALGRLAPAIREAWRKEKISAEVAKAFAEHADAGVQEELYERLKKQGSYALSEYTIRRELCGHRVKVSECDELALVGEGAYLAAGGTLTDSLFDEDRTVDDVPLVRKLARERMQAECDRLKAEGWAWAKISLDDDDPREWDFQALRGGTGGEEIGDDFTAEERAQSGCLVYIAKVYDPKGGSRAEIAVSFGLVDTDDEADGDEDGEDLPPVSSVIGDDDEEAAEGDEPEADASVVSDDPFKISGALVNTITEAMTLAAAKALARDPDLARDIVFAALTARFMSPAVIRNEGMPQLRGGSTNDFAVQLAWIRKQDQSWREMRFAEAVSSTLDLRESTWQFKSRDSGIEALIAELPGHWYLAAMREHFGAGDYFKRATKETALAAIAEIKEAGFGAGLAPVDELAGMKKAALAMAAAEAATACGWLPPQLRHPAYTLCLRQSEAA